MIRVSEEDFEEFLPKIERAAIVILRQPYAKASSIRRLEKKCLLSNMS